MARGRHPKPQALKNAQGNPGKKRKIKAAVDEMQPFDPDVTASPVKLKPDERRVWNHLVPLLRERRFVQVTDFRTLARYCKFVSLFEALAPKVTAGNIVKTTKSEHVTMDRLNKHFLAMLHLDKRLESLEDRFGLSPSARQTLLARAAAQLPRLPFEEKPPIQQSDGSAPAAQMPAEQRPPSPIGIGRLN